MAPKILVAEDNARIAEMICETLKLGGYEVAHVPDGVAAFEFLGLDLPQGISKELAGDERMIVRNDWGADSGRPTLPDLLISDCVMPRLDGYGLVSALSHNELLKNIPVIVLTAKPKMEQPFKALPNVVDFICKPFPEDRLLEAVARALKKN